MQYDLLANNPLKTRADVQRAMLDLWTPLQPYFLREGAAVRLGETQASHGDPAGLLETFARPLWGIAPLAAGGGNFPDWSIFLGGLAEGVDPENPKYWGATRDFDQSFVEMAALGVALALVPEKIWDPLPTRTQEQLIAWLSQINQFRCVDNNWQFFRVLTNLGLRRVGAAWDPDMVVASLDRIDEFYRGDGWYVDGNTTQRDYYIPMAFHYYGLLYAQLNPEDTLRASRYVERSTLFAPQFANWFATDGSALPIGRSLTYRFAQGAFWGALAMTGVEAVPWGRMKGLYLRHLRWWFRQPCFSDGGLLTIGYAYPNLIMSESYNAPGSPYWSCKAFLALALAPDHPFWTAEEESYQPPPVSAQPKAGLVLCHDQDRSHLFALSSNQKPGWNMRYGSQKYAKFAYSTAFGFSIANGGSVPEFGNGENMLALTDDGIDWRVREMFLDEKQFGNTLYTRWAPWPDVEVESWLAPAMPGHVRVHRVRTKRALKSFEGGFSINRIREKQIHEERSGFAAARYQNAYSAVRDLGELRQGRVIWLEPNSNLVLPLTSLPHLLGEHHIGEFWLITGIVGLPGCDQEQSGLDFLNSLLGDQSGSLPKISQANHVILDLCAL